MKYGYVRIRAERRDRETFLRECGERHIPLREIRFSDTGETECDVPERALSLLGEENVTILRESCNRDIRRAMGRNLFFLFLMGLLILGAGLSTLFIWDVRIEGNTKVSEAEIRDVLEELGAGTGAFRPTLRANRISNDALLRIPELSWMTVNIRGCTLRVMVHEKRPEPELADTEGERNIVAARDGIVEELIILRGKALVSPGDAVTKGQILIASEMPSLHSGDRQVWADGVIRGRTRYVLEVSGTEKKHGKRYTGRIRERFSLLVGKRRINFCFDSGNPYGDCDKIYSENDVLLPGRVKTPFRILHERFAEYVPENRETESGTEKELRRFLEEQLRLRVGEQGEILKTEYTVEKTGERITVILTAECSEEIGISENEGKKPAPQG